MAINSGGDGTDIELITWALLDDVRSFEGSLGSQPIYRSVLYLVGLTFLKYLDDQKANDLASEVVPERDSRYVVPPETHWEVISSDPTGEAFSQGIEAFESNPNNHELQDVLTTLGLRELPKTPELFQRLINAVSNNIRVGTGKELSALVDRLIAYGMQGAGWRGIEHYTPSGLSHLLVELLDPAAGSTIYDPTCGTGSLLNAAYAKSERKNARNHHTKLFGQEINRETAALAKINTILHSGLSGQIVTGNTLSHPKFVHGVTKLRQFDYVVANPPMGLQLDGSTLQLLAEDPFRRFSHGVPRRTADLLFVQHVVASLKDSGRAVMLASPSVLSLGAEEKIRESLVEADVIEAIISLPSKLLPGTGIALAVLVLNKNKPAASSGQVLFVYAEEDYEQDRSTRRISDQQREKIVKTVLERRECSGFSAFASSSEIREANYGLIPGRYIDFVDRETFLGGSVHWETLSNVAEVLPGARVEGRTNAEGNTPVIQGRDLNAPRLIVDDLERVATTEDRKELAYTRVNDILIQRIGLRPHAYHVDEELSGVLVRDSVYIIRLKDGFRWYSRYLVEFFNSDPGQTLLSIRVRGVGAPTILVRDLRELSIPLPEEDVATLINDLHDVEHNLLDRVGKARGIRQRLFGIDDPQQVDHQLQTLSTEARVLQESLVQVEDVDFQIRNFYPYPLAYAYRTVSSIQEPALRYQERLRVAENILAFLGTVGLSFASYAQVLSEQDNDYLTTSYLGDCWSGGISPGDWRELGRRSGSLIRGKHQHPAIEAFSSLWFKGKGGKASDFAKATLKLVDYKNAHKHDRGPRTPSALEHSDRELQACVEWVLKHLSMFIQYRLRLIQDVDIDWRTSSVTLKTLLYTGDHPGLRQEQVETSQALSKNKLYVVLSKNHWVPLYPWMSVENCPVCDNRETYSIDRWDGRDKPPALKSFEHPHPFDSPKVAERIGADLKHWMRMNFYPGEGVTL